MTRNLFCFGLGYSALALARRLRDDGWRIAGTARTSAKIDELSREGFAAIPFDGASWSDALQAAFEQADAVLVSTPPDERGDPVLNVGTDRLRALAARWRWLGYLSSTGVYGDKQGGWVDETTPPAPSGPRSARRLDAEIAWQAFAAETGAPLHIFRIAGIYGPERNPLEALRAGTARRFDKPGQIFSRIHVDDLAAALTASMAHPSPGAVYNVCDDEPASQADVIAYGAQILGIAPPPLEAFAAAEPTLSDMAKSFYRDSKRVRNDTMKRALGVTLAYPTYREGFNALK
jgi:nucleoside-diphosphate-sugar epimerase